MTHVETHPPSTRSHSGHASLKVELVAGESAVTSAHATNPLKLLTPRARGQSVWAYLSNFGGGMVAGDETHLNLTLGPGTKAYVATQASTKVYRNPTGRACGQVTEATLGPDALLVYAPDVIQPFADSIYTQRQTFRLEATASLVMLDWVSSGRTERGEQWAFSRYQSRNEIFVDGERRLLDSVLLDPADGPLVSGERMGRYHCLALVLVIGPQVAGAAAALLEKISGREVPRRATLAVSASAVSGGALLRVAGVSVERVRHELYEHLAFTSALLGDDPWSRKW